MHIVHYKDEYVTFDNAKVKPDGLAVVAVLFKVSQYYVILESSPSRLEDLKHEDLNFRMLIYQLSVSDNYLMNKVTDRLYDIPCRGLLVSFFPYLKYCN